MAFAEGVPTVVVQLDQPRALAYTLGAMRRTRELLTARGESADADPIDRLLTLPLQVWAMLDAEGRSELTIEQVEDLIHPGNLRDVATAIRALERVSLPEPKEGDDTADPTTAGPKLAG